MNVVIADTPALASAPVVEGASDRYREAERLSLLAFGARSAVGRADEVLDVLAASPTVASLVDLVRPDRSPEGCAPVSVATEVGRVSLRPVRTGHHLGFEMLDDRGMHFGVVRMSGGAAEVEVSVTLCWRAGPERRAAEAAVLAVVQPYLVREAGRIVTGVVDAALAQGARIEREVGLAAAHADALDAWIASRGDARSTFEVEVDDEFLPVEAMSPSLVAVASDEDGTSWGYFEVDEAGRARFAGGRDGAAYAPHGGIVAVETALSGLLLVRGGLAGPGGQALDRRAAAKVVVQLREQVRSFRAASARMGRFEAWLAGA